MRRATSLVTWFALLFAFWELLVGTFQTEEMLAGLIASAIGSLFAVLLAGLGLLLAYLWVYAWRLSARHRSDRATTSGASE